jgi:hypothetical protein
MNESQSDLIKRMKHKNPSRVQKITDNKDLDAQILLIVHTLAPREEVVIKADEFGRPGRILIMARKTTVLDYDLEEKK